MIDRRHVALGMSIAAAIGTSESGPMEVPVLQGFEELEAGPFTLDEARPKRVWQITTQLVLPREAEQFDTQSGLVVEVRFVDQAKHAPVTYRLNDCNEKALGVSSVEYETWIDIDDPFADCVPETACEQTVCLEIESTDDQSTVDVEWTATASVETTDRREEPVDVIEVPIEITHEEIEP